MREQNEALDRAHATVVAIGTGDLEVAKEFKRKYQLPYPVLVDDDLLSYKVVGAQQGKLTDWAKPTVIKAGLLALSHGAMQGKVGKHSEFLGATTIIRPDGTVPYAWVNGDYSDDAPLRNVLAALQPAAATS